MAEPGPAWLCRACSGGRLSRVGAHLRCDLCQTEVDNGGGYWIFDPDFVPTAFSRQRQRHLAEISGRHFWFGPRQRLLASMLDRGLDRRCARALELGCGGGSFLPVLEELAEQVVGIDAYGDSLASAHAVAPAAHLAQANIENPPLGEGSFELIVLLDVLEHVDPDAILGHAARMAVDDAWMLISVPAFPALWSILDEAAGHRCRYRLGSLRPELERNRWDVVAWTHYQALAFPAVWLGRRLGRGRLVRLERQPVRLVGWFFGLLNSFETRVFAGRSLRWGSSLVVLCRRTP
jgi:SAM-dependent methyltransferase